MYQWPIDVFLLNVLELEKNIGTQLGIVKLSPGVIE